MARRPEPEPLETETRANLPEVSVSELSTALKRTLEDAYGYVRVRGELGKVSYHSNGHIYFDLKDDRACIAGVVWRSSAARIRLKLETGLEVTATGRITTYPGRSQYQIVAEAIEPAGLGALMALIEERKRKLAAEGLFDEARKQLLPYLPDVIGVVTSPTGAVIRDILHRLADRFPRRVLLWPVRVQGDGSAAEVAAAITGFNALARGGAIPQPDLIIVARGGGSLEDLWSFNDEAVVRAAAASLIPLISAVGHETDVTLIDFAADRRAPTPTAAAEMAVPVRADLIAAIAELARRAATTWARGTEARRRDLRAAARALPGADRLLQSPRQRLDLAAERLPRALRANAEIHHRRFARTAARLNPAALRVGLERERRQVRAAGERARLAIGHLRARRQERLDGLAARLSTGLRAYTAAQRTKIARERETADALIARARRAVRAQIERRSGMLAQAGGLLAALSYQRVLARGFALVREAEGMVRSAAQVRRGAVLDIEFADGHVSAVATGDAASEPAARPAAAPSRTDRPSRRGGDQGSLF